MSQKKRGLGRGLSDLGLGELLHGGGSASVAVKESSKTVPLATGHEADGQLCHLSIERIIAGQYQPRTQFAPGALDDLAQSIRAQGVIQPIVVRKKGGQYELIAGERRWRAAQQAGLTEVPAIIRELTDDAAIAMSLIENIQREDLNAIEEAVALNRLLEEFDLTHQEVADAVGKSRTAVSNLIRLLKLHPEVKSLVEQGELEMGHARALLTLDGLQQVEVARAIVSRALSVRQAEAWVKKLQDEGDRSATVPVVIDPNIKQLQNQLSDKLCARVVIRHQPKGKGQLVVHYNSVDELDGILEHIS